MPELPEVEAARRLMERKVVGRVILDVVATEQGGGPREGLFDDKVLQGEASATTFRDKLLNRKFVSSRRKGKQLCFELDDGCGLMCHLGMTGALLVRGEKAPSYKNAKLDYFEWPPRFAKLEVLLDDGGAIAYCDSRRFGRVRVDNAPAKALEALAPDPLCDCPPLEAFSEVLGQRSSAIKAILLDQRALVSGVGNWVADEVLYAAGVHPATPAHRLDESQIASIRNALIDIVSRACDVDADAARFPASWLFHHRWKHQTSGSAESPIGRIHFDTVGGRTTAFVPARQTKRPRTSPHFEDAALTPSPPSRRRRRHDAETPSSPVGH